MKKPKLLKYPKMPKFTASPEIWERYKVRVLGIKAKNEAKLKPYNDAKDFIERTKTFVEGIKNPFLKKRSVTKKRSHSSKKSKGKKRR